MPQTPMMIYLLADSGSSKTTWTLLSKQGVLWQVNTVGLNPFHTSGQEINAVLQQLKVERNFDGLKAIRFFGSGCTPEKIPWIKGLLQEVFACQDVEIKSDALGAAISLLGQQKGLACILGTGSNACYYNGQEIEKSTPCGGYIVGDEGSGAVIGREFIHLLIKNQCSPKVKQDFMVQYGLDYAAIISAIYHEEQPNRWLAQFAPFLRAHLDDPLIEALLTAQFKAFFENNVLPLLQGLTRLPEGTPQNLTEKVQHPRICFTGSIAYYFKAQVQAVAKSYNLQVDLITKSPMEGLIDYYSQILTQGERL